MYSYFILDGNSNCYLKNGIRCETARSVLVKATVNSQCITSIKRNSGKLFVASTSDRKEERKQGSKKERE